eukprot:5650820-Amphidinium_carterae.2
MVPKGEARAPFSGMAKGPVLVVKAILAATWLATIPQNVVALPTYQHDVLNNVYPLSYTVPNRIKQTTKHNLGHAAVFFFNTHIQLAKLRQTHLTDFPSENHC